MIKNVDISYTLANSKEGIVAKILDTESGPKKDHEKIELFDLNKMTSNAVNVKG